MSVFTNIQAALDQQLSGMASLPGVAWENNAYEPTQGELYLRVTHLPGDTFQSTLGGTGQDVTNGIYQVDVFAEAGQGKKAALDMADLVADRFKRGTVLTYNGVTVTVRSAGRQASIISNGWYQIPVIITYRSFTEARA